MGFSGLVHILKLYFRASKEMLLQQQKIQFGCPILEFVWWIVAQKKSSSGEINELIDFRSFYEELLLPATTSLSIRLESNRAQCRKPSPDVRNILWKAFTVPMLARCGWRRSRYDMSIQNVVTEMTPEG